MTIGSFRNEGTFDVYRGKNTKKARSNCPVELHDTAGDVMDLIDRAHVLSDIKRTPGLGLERLGGEDNKYSVRVNIQYRVTFYWIDGQAEAVSIEKHYGE